MTIEFVKTMDDVIAFNEFHASDGDLPAFVAELKQRVADAG